MTKTCTGCGESKRLGDFHRKASQKSNGRTSRCKGCASKRKRNLEAPRVLAQQEALDLLAEGLKHCTKCESTKTTDDFSPKKGSTTGLQSWCKECVRSDSRRRQTSSRQVRFGIDFDDALAAQGGACLVCGTTSPPGNFDGWAVDHDHKCCPGSKRTCGRCVRGILCSKCNVGIGMLGDSVETLMSAVSYLMSFESVLELADATG